MQLSPPQHLSDNLEELNSFLDYALCEFAQPQVLPKQQKLLPNQHSWPKTHAIMGTDQKTKWKSLHNNPYSGGKRSGNKAKPDVRVPLVSGSKARCIHCIFIPTCSVNCWLYSCIISISHWPLHLLPPTYPTIVVSMRIIHTFDWIDWIMFRSLAIFHPQLQHHSMALCYPALWHIFPLPHSSIGTTT